MSGTGLFSLAARQPGAKVRSFDYDQSAACSLDLKHRYRAADTNWRIEKGSILDDEYLATVGKFDVAYSWGFLHHTGQMYKAFATLCRSSRYTENCSSRFITTKDG